MAVLRVAEVRARAKMARVAEVEVAQGSDLAVAVEEASRAVATRVAEASDAAGRAVAMVAAKSEAEGTAAAEWAQVAAVATGLVALGLVAVGGLVPGLVVATLARGEDLAAAVKEAEATVEVAVGWKASETMVAVRSAAAMVVEGLAAAEVVAMPAVEAWAAGCWAKAPQVLGVVPTAAAGRTDSEKWALAAVAARARGGMAAGVEAQAAKVEGVMVVSSEEAELGVGTAEARVVALVGVVQAVVMEAAEKEGATAVAAMEVAATAAAATAAAATAEGSVAAEPVGAAKGLAEEAKDRWVAVSAEAARAVAVTGGVRAAGSVAPVEEAASAVEECIAQNRQQRQGCAQSGCLH